MASGFEVKLQPGQSALYLYQDRLNKVGFDGRAKTFADLEREWPYGYLTDKFIGHRSSPRTAWLRAVALDQGVAAEEIKRIVENNQHFIYTS